MAEDNTEHDAAAFDIPQAAMPPESRPPKVYRVPTNAEIDRHRLELEADYFGYATPEAYAAAKAAAQRAPNPKPIPHSPQNRQT